MKLLAVIPARGGSKRLPRKNIRPLGGVPLIAYTIRAALDAELFTRVIVSTDDAEIAEIAQSFGADIPFMRDTLADDHSPVSLVTLDALERLGEPFDAVAQLMPNCPFRTASDVRTSFEHFTHSEIETQLSVTRYGWLNPWWAMKLETRLEPLFPEALKTRSQDLATLYCPTGAIWWARPPALKEHKTFYAPNYGGFELAWDHALDIDDEDDWKMAEALQILRERDG